MESSGQSVAAINSWRLCHKLNFSDVVLGQKRTISRPARRRPVILQAPEQVQRQDAQWCPWTGSQIPVSSPRQKALIMNKSHQKPQLTDFAPPRQQLAATRLQRDREFCLTDFMSCAAG